MHLNTVDALLGEGHASIEAMIRDAGTEFWPIDSSTGDHRAEPW